MGTLKLAKGDIEGAIVSYEKALQLNPKNDYAKENLETAMEILAAQEKPATGRGKG